MPLNEGFIVWTGLLRLTSDQTIFIVSLVHWAPNWVLPYLTSTLPTQAKFPFLTWVPNLSSPPHATLTEPTQ